jgi:hypothetical protein
MFTIEKNVPIPASTRAVGASKYPWEQMTVGDSFAIPVSNLPSSDYRPTPTEKLKKRGYRVQTRKLIENGQSVVRVWRIN